MSEVKGLLLGVILVVTVFGAIAGVMLSAYNKAAATAYDKVTQEFTITPLTPVKAAQPGSLTF